MTTMNYSQAKSYLRTKLNSSLVLFCSLIVFALGCGGEKEKTSNEKTKPDYDASSFLAKSKLEGAQDIIDARKNAKDKDEIIVVGRIGGSVDPWIKGRAAFSVVDRSIKACSDDMEDRCETPWDYCCETDKLKNGMVLVKFVESDGKVVPHDARDIFPLKELQTVFIKGTAKRDDSGNLTVLATQMFPQK